MLVTIPGWVVTNQIKGVRIFTKLKKDETISALDGSRGLALVQEDGNLAGSIVIVASRETAITNALTSTRRWTVKVTFMINQ